MNRIQQIGFGVDVPNKGAHPVLREAAVLEQNSPLGTRVNLVLRVHSVAPPPAAPTPVRGSRESAESLNRFLGSVIHELSGIYEVTDSGEIRAFLEKNLHLVPVLREAAVELQKYFSGIKPTLEINVEPESGFAQLFGIVRVGDEIKDPRERLHAFDREWWLSNCRRAAGRVNFDVEYV